MLAPSATPATASVNQWTPSSTRVEATATPIPAPAPIRAARSRRGKPAVITNAIAR